jgi:hypothetical protein
MLSKVLNIAKWIAGVVGGVTAIAGIVTFIYTQGIKAEQKKLKSTSLEAKVDKLVVSDSIKNDKLDRMLYFQEISNNKQQQMDKKLDNLNASYINHLKADKKIDELIKYLEGTQEQLKKNGSYLLPIAPN